MYIVNSPSLIKLIQKQPKVFAFAPIVAHFLRSVCYSSKEANDIVEFNVDGEAGDRGYLATFNKISRPILAPGPDLDKMNRAMIENIVNFMPQLDRAAGLANTLMLSHWLRHQVTIATTNAIYGPSNPFLDLKVKKAFW